jgi:hypothetical protein
MAAKYGWLNNADWTTQTVRQHSLEAKVKKYDKTVMFPSSHDITHHILKNQFSFLEKY